MTYSYECRACKAAWEAEQSIKDAPLRFCPTCGQEAAGRVILSAPHYHLRGWGWAASGYDKTKTHTD